MNIVVNNKKISLSQQNFIGSGGEGQVFQLGNLAFKIVHDGKTPIPKEKIAELNSIGKRNVLAPMDPIYKTDGAYVGYTMPFVQKTEFLCKLFSRSYRDQNNISPEDIVDLVREMQETLQAIHNVGILVVDFNEMNFLTDDKYQIPYFIDVDSYQTKSYPATALMESVRDRTAKHGVFNKGTDWFAFAVVSFQLYMGIHPYKGSAPGYKPKDWSQRMDDGVSVFSKGASLPPSCQDWTVIPKPHLDWFKQVFVNKVRSAPPLPEGQIIASIAINITNTTGFTVEKIKECLVGYDKMLEGQNKSVAKSTNIDYVEFCEYTGNVYLKTETGAIYKCIKVSTRNGDTYLVEHVANTVQSKANKLFSGIVNQNVLGKTWLLIINEDSSIYNIGISELDGHRVIDAIYRNKVAIVISEKSGTYYRSIIEFNEDKYEIVSVVVDNNIRASLVYLPKGLYLSIVDDSELEVFYPNKIKNRKIMTHAPVTNASTLISEGNTVMFYDGNTLYKLSTK